MNRLTLTSAKLHSTRAQLLLQTLNDAAVHLADPALAQIKRRTDLFHCQFFVVIKNNDQAFVAVEAFCDQSHQVVLLDSASWIFAFLVLKNIDLTDIFVTVRFVPFLV